MKDLMSAIYGNYIIPNIEDEEAVHCIAEIYREMTPTQGKQWEKALKLYASKAFLLGVRTGVDLERFLKDAPQAGVI